MANYPLEIILSRQLADSLSMAVFIVDTKGDLIFYNETAENILGRRFDETGEMPASEWSTIFKPKDKQGNDLKPEDLPLVKTFTNHKPAHGSFWIESLTGTNYLLSVTSIPIIGREQKFLGALAMFWKEEKL